MKASAEQFGVKEVTFVGDRGMIKSPQINALPDGCTYITALSKKEINSLITADTIQLGLFDSSLKEVVDTESGLRYILRCNPLRRLEVRESRSNKMRKLLEFAKDRNKFLEQSKRAKIETAYKQVKAKIAQYNLAKLIILTKLKPEDEKLTILINRSELRKARELDGCYVIKSNVSKDVSATKIHARYKDLKYVEDGFRTMKQSHLELRPVYVRKKERTAAHVFIVMLSYMIVRRMRLRLAGGGEAILTKEVIESLGHVALHQASYKKGVAVKDNDSLVYNVPLPSDINQSYLDLLNIKLPEVFINGMTVAKPKIKDSS